MSVPGDNIADAIDLAYDDLCELYPDATITVVVVAEVTRAGQEPIYPIGGGPDTTVGEGERIVRLAGEATRAAALLRRIQQG